MTPLVELYDDKNVLQRFCPPKNQLLKWIGNKQKFASQISSYFPLKFNRYIEPFLGSGAILATVRPQNGLGSDTFKPLIDIWQQLKNNPKKVVEWYAERRNLIGQFSKEEVYFQVRHSYNKKPNGADFLFLSRSCYGGVVRFRKLDGYMSTPCGVHTPIEVQSFEHRVSEWYQRIKNSQFLHQDYKAAFKQAKKGDLIYCDPPYSYSQGILYGAQSFDLETLLREIEKAKKRGVFVALSIDGNKKSGDFICDLPIPHDLFEREMFIELGRSMLKRFQMEGRTLEKEHVSDRLLLTY
jgi:DNA adenine methylase